MASMPNYFNTKL